MRKIGLVLSVLLILYGSVAVALHSVYPEDVKLERFLCRYFLVCDSERQISWAYDQLLSDEPSRKEAAVETLKEVLRRDPANAYRWCDLGNALFELGDVEAAHYSFDRAVSLAPNVAPVLLSAGDFYFTSGENGAALEVFSHVLGLVRDYDETIFRTYLEMGVSTEDILQAGVPLHAEAGRSFFQYALRDESATDLDQIWAWLDANELTDDQTLRSYVDFLLKGKEYAHARTVFSDHWGPATYAHENDVANPSFEAEPVGGQLDWVIRPVEHVEIIRQSEVAHSGSWSLRLRFDGEENTEFRHVSQKLVVVPGKHVFRAQVRTDGLTTDQGVYFRIFDAENAARFDVQTEQVMEATDWTAFEKAFVVPPGTDLLEIQIVRKSSWKFDNKIAGTLWIDDVLVRRVN